MDLCVFFLNISLFLHSVSEEDRKLNATYIISVARKLGCSVFLLPEDIMEVKEKEEQKLILVSSLPKVSAN